MSVAAAARQFRFRQYRPSLMLADPFAMRTYRKHGARPFGTGSSPGSARVGRFL